LVSRALRAATKVGEAPELVPFGEGGMQYHCSGGGLNDWGDAPCKMQGIPAQGADAVPWDNHPCPQSYVPPPKSLPAYGNPRRVGYRGGRMTWEDSDYIYQWDSKKGEVEKYRKSNKEHLGGFDPDDPSRQISPAVPSRSPSGY
jgi:Cytotoxic